MLIANWTSQFKKDLKRLNKRGNDLEELKKVMKMIEAEVELPEEIYRAHKLRPTKDYNDCWECHIGGRNSDWLLVYKFYSSEDLVVFIRTGTHADLF